MSVSRWLDRLSFAATIDELQTHVDRLDVVDDTDRSSHRHRRLDTSPSPIC